MTERLKALKEAERIFGVVLDFIHNDMPKCPHCGQNHEVSANEWYRLYEEGAHDVYCPSCQHLFTVYTHVERTFSTDLQE